MILIRISGGLGNQLFQYALGRALSLKSKTEFKIDKHYYDLNFEPERSLTLYKFNISTPIATNQDYKKTHIPNPTYQNLLSKTVSKIYRTLESRKPLQKRKMILEDSFNFHPEILAIDHDCYLSGVWQSEKYFKDYEDIIKRDLLLKEPLSEQAQKIQSIMSEGISISIHIRRGDTVAKPNLIKKYGTLAGDYYKNAISYIQDKTQNKNVRLFVFSDDIAWVKENMTFGPETVYVSEYGLPDYEELTLMSFCKHNIIARSSFSWWGAWLNQNKDKIVIAPQKSFGVENINADDLIPYSWVKM